MEKNMYKMIIVDDEPIIQMGISSLLDYNAHNIDIIKICSTGQEALNAIRSLSPDLVMMDINIPCLNGLEVMEIIKKENARPPQFIILSCHDEFEYAKQAVRIGASDYLLKNELTQETLEEALNKAISQIKNTHSEDSSDYEFLFAKRISFLDNFFLKLLNNWFDSHEHIQEMMTDLEISFPGAYYVCLTLGYPEDYDTKAYIHSTAFYAATCNLIRELCKKYCNSYVTPWDSKHLALILAFSEALTDTSMNSQILPCVQHILDMIYLYQNIQFSAGIGSPVTALDQCALSFNESSIALRQCDQNHSIIIYNDTNHPSPHPFNISIIREGLTTAMDNYDIFGVRELLNQILDLLRNYTTEIETALAICSSVLHFVDLSYKGSEHFLENIGQNEVPYHSLYKCKTVSQAIQWFQTFIDDFCRQLTTDFENKRNWLLPSIKKYIEEHYQEPISLSDISACFNVSCGYISTIFKKSSGIGFNECVTQAKIRHAKQLLLEPEIKIYDVAYQLGYSDPYYFSKVFKKYTGFSPKEYIRSKSSDREK